MPRTEKVLAARLGDFCHVPESKIDRGQEAQTSRNTLNLESADAFKIPVRNFPSARRRT